MKFIFIKFLKFILYPFKDLLVLISQEFIEKKIFNSGLIIARQNIKKKKIKNFSDVEFSVFSQWGDDGIIDWLSHNLKLKRDKFVEIGVEDYWESNTRFFLKKNNFKGLLLDGSHTHIKKIKSQNLYWKYDLIAKNLFVTKENINQTLKKNNFDKKLSLFSLDIDGNDFWILNKINIDVDIIVCEYNGLFGDLHEITIPYKKNFSRTNEHYSNLFYGCSIRSLISLFKKKKFIFLGTNSAGNNAYFVNKKKYNLIKNRIKEIKIFAPKFREARDKQYQKSFVSSSSAINVIKNKFVYDLKKKKLIKIKNLGKIYSKNFFKI